MIRKIIKINEEKCNGCGVCVDACHEGAIGIVDGKAKLLREDYCDGLGDCLPVCPTEAITFEEREAHAYDENAVIATKTKSQNSPCGCPNSAAKNISHDASDAVSKLLQWPIQIKLMPVNASYFDGANLLVAADCTAYAYGNFCNDFIKNKITIIGCPKLDLIDYSEKLTQIIAKNDIKSVTVVRMEVPCCGGLENALKKALKNSGKFIPLNVFTISIDGKII